MKEKLRSFGKKIQNSYDKPVWQWIVGLGIYSFALEFLLEVLGRRSLLNAVLFLIHSPLVFIYNTFIVFFTLSLSLLIRRRAFMLGFITVLWLTVGICNCVVLGYRITPFSFIDITMISDVFSMMDIYFNSFQQILIFGGLILVVIAIVIAFIMTPRIKGRMHFIQCIITVLSAFVVVYVMTILSVKTTLIADEFTNLGTAYKDYGFAYCFSNSVIDIGISKPQDYSEQRIDEVFDSTNFVDAKCDFAQKPDIIILQLESFIDINRVSGIHTDKESIPNFKAYQEQFPSGWLTVPAIGAGTANTEFEIITGMKSKLFGAGEYPYKTVLTDTPCESMAQVLRRKYGYGTHAIHNNKARFYSRNESYASLGFETFTSVEYMQNVNRTKTGWAKDDCLPDEIFKALDSDEQQDFILCISVQGHGRYPKKELKCEEHVKVTFDSEDPVLTNQFGYYVNQCYEMDQMIAELKKRLDDRGKPYVLFMYGDHIPALTFDDNPFIKGEQDQTEYVIVNNIGLEMEDRDIYTYELSDYLMQALHMKRGVMQKVHETYYDSDDQTAFTDVAAEIQYDILYGNRYLYEKIYPYEKVEMKLGIDDIVLNSVSFDETTGNIIAYGENFTTFSKILIDDERMETVFVDSKTLMILPEEISEEPEAGAVITVAQIDKDKHELTRTDAIIYGQQSSEQILEETSEESTAAAPVTTEAVTTEADVMADEEEAEEEDFENPSPDKDDADEAATEEKVTESVSQ